MMMMMFLLGMLAAYLLTNIVSSAVLLYMDIKSLGKFDIKDAIGLIRKIPLMIFLGTAFAFYFFIKETY